MAKKKPVSKKLAKSPPVQKVKAPPAQKPAEAALCEYCDSPIPKLRREALPGITTCVKCAAAHPAPINPAVLADVYEDLGYGDIVDGDGGDD